MILSQDLRSQDTNSLLQMQRAAARSNSMMYSLPASPASRMARPSVSSKLRERLQMQRSVSSSMIKERTAPVDSIQSMEDAIVDSPQEMALRSLSRTPLVRSKSAAHSFDTGSCPPPASRKRISCKANMTPAAPPTRPASATRNLMTSLPTPVLLPHHPNKKSRVTELERGLVRNGGGSVVSSDESTSISPHSQRASNSSMSISSDASADTTWNKPPKKSVDFNNRVKVRRIPLLKDTPRSIIQDVYFSRDELTVIRADVRRKLVRHFNQQQGWGDAMDAVEAAVASGDVDYDSNGVFYLRGLESELPCSKTDRKLLRQHARSQVMKSQFMHQVMGAANDADALAMTYAKRSQMSVDLAILAAVQDEMEARQILQQA